LDSDSNFTAEFAKGAEKTRSIIFLCELGVLGGKLCN